MGTITTDMQDGIAVLELGYGVTNAISPGLVADLAGAFELMRRSLLTAMKRMKRKS